MPTYQGPTGVAGVIQPGGLQQREARAAGTGEALGFRDLLVGADDRHHRHHDRRARKAAARLVDDRRRRRLVARHGAAGEELAERGARLALEADEAEGFATAVVGHPHRRAQQPQQRRVVRAGVPEQPGGYGAPLVEGNFTWRCTARRKLVN